MASLLEVFGNIIDSTIKNLTEQIEVLKKENESILKKLDYKSLPDNADLSMDQIIPVLFAGKILIEHVEVADVKTYFWRWNGCQFESREGVDDEWEERFPTIDPSAIWRVFA